MLRAYQNRKGRDRGSMDRIPLNPPHPCGTVSTTEDIQFHSVLTNIVPKQRWLFIPKTKEYTHAAYLINYITKIMVSLITLYIYFQAKNKSDI